MNPSLIKDARGNPSITLTLILLTWLVITVKFLFAGLGLPMVGEFPPMTASEYGIAISPLLAGWLGREWTEKKVKP